MKRFLVTLLWGQCIRQTGSHIFKAGTTNKQDDLPVTRHTECIVYRMIMARAVFHRVKAKAAVAPDFSMIASEVQNVVRAMRQQGWVIGCLYNQETDEHPQLYF